MRGGQHDSTTDNKNNNTNGQSNNNNNNNNSGVGGGGGVGDTYVTSSTYVSDGGGVGGGSSSNDGSNNSGGGGGGSGTGLLQQFYADPSRHAYTFQSYAFLSRIRAQVEAPRPGDAPLLEVRERSVGSDRHCFAANCRDAKLFTPSEWSIYCEWHDFLCNHFKDALALDGTIYLRADPLVCMQRLRKRARPGEHGAVGLDYLQALHKRHEGWLMHGDRPETGRICVLDGNEDIEDPEDGHLALDRLVQQVRDFVSELRTTHHSDRTL